MYVFLIILSQDQVEGIDLFYEFIDPFSIGVELLLEGGGVPE